MHTNVCACKLITNHIICRGHCGHDCMVFEFTPNTAIVLITTKVLSLNPVHGKLYAIQHYMIKFVSDLRQFGGFLRFPPSIKLTAKI